MVTVTSLLRDACSDSELPAALGYSGMGLSGRGHGWEFDQGVHRCPSRT